MRLLNASSTKAGRKTLKSTASVLGLATGAIGWSGLAQAASEETNSQMMLLPEHYDLMDNGVVVFKLETGENLSLTADQYLILNDGLLLITDELAQASIYSLPVMGSVRAQLLSDLEQVATIDGTVAEATPAQTLSITEGQAPRLSEQVELQSYEVAQASDESSSEPGEALTLGMSVAPGAMVLLNMLNVQEGEAPYWFNTVDWRGTMWSEVILPNEPIGPDMPERIVGVSAMVAGFNDPDGYSAVYFGHSRQDALASTENLLLNPEDDSLDSLYVYVQNISIADGGEANPTMVDGSYFTLFAGPAFWDPGSTGYDPGTFSTYFGVDLDQTASAGWSGSETRGDVWNFEVVVEDQNGNFDIWPLTIDYSAIA